MEIKSLFELTTAIEILELLLNRYNTFTLSKHTIVKYFLHTHSPLPPLLEYTLSHVRLNFVSILQKAKSLEKCKIVAREFCDLFVTN